MGCEKTIRVTTHYHPTLNLFDVVGNVAADPFLAAVPGVVDEAAAKGWQYATAAGSEPSVVAVQLETQTRGSMRATCTTRRGGTERDPL